MVNGMKKVYRYSCIILCTVILGLILGLCILIPDDGMPSFLAHSATGTEEIQIYMDGDTDGYVFLPSYAELSRVTLKIPPETVVQINNMPVSDQMNCGAYQLGTPYSFSVDGSQATTLWFYQSSNIASVYISTVSGGMENVHATKGKKEVSEVSVYTEEGQLNYFSEDGVISGRGNATWDYDKKPYSITLTSEADLLEMGQAKEWVLLANAADSTGLNNKVALDLARQLGMAWVPEFRYVDLYLNGVYNGVYMLCEKVDVGPERLDLDYTAGDFLCKVDLHMREQTLRNPFVSGMGQMIEISYPEKVNELRKQEIQSVVTQMERYISSGGTLPSSVGFDLDSWVRRYLIDVITNNIDGDLASSYFYCSNGTIYAGPLWDYDMTLGNSVRNENPSSYGFQTPYYEALCKNEAFRNRVEEIYHTECIALLQSMIDGGIETAASDIQDAVEMNRIRWKEMIQDDSLIGVHMDRSAEDIRQYLAERVEFLNRLWIDGMEYCTISFVTPSGDSMGHISIEKGSTVARDLLPDGEWNESESGATFDPDCPVVKNIVLVKSVDDVQQLPIPGEQNDETTTTEKISYLTVAMMAGMFLILVLVEFRRQYLRKRGGT